jgi:hypothetical protein
MQVNQRHQTALPIKRSLAPIYAASLLIVIFTVKRA